MTIPCCPFAYSRIAETSGELCSTSHFHLLPVTARLAKAAQRSDQCLRCFLRRIFTAVRKHTCFQSSHSRLAQTLCVIYRFPTVSVAAQVKQRRVDKCGLGIVFGVPCHRTIPV